MMLHDFIYLASQSPRRVQLLQQLGVAVTRADGITPALVEACWREVGAVDSL